MAAFTPPRKHSLHYILSPPEARPRRTDTVKQEYNEDRLPDAPDVPGVKRPAVPSSPPSRSSDYASLSRHYHPALDALPASVLSLIAYHVVVDERGRAGRPARLLPLLHTSRSVNAALNFDANPQLYNWLFRATFDLGALLRRTQWMFDVKTDVPGTSRKTELFGDPRSWAYEYRDRWELRKRMRICIDNQTVNVPGVSSIRHLERDFFALWFLWTENDQKNLVFLTEECRFQDWIVIYYRDDMLKDSLDPGFPVDSPTKALGIWTALLSGTDLFAERSATEVDEKIYMLRPYVFGCPKYEMLYAPWQHRRLPLCAKDCTEHTSMTTYSAPYTRFGHQHTRAPPFFILGSYLLFLRLVERHPGRIGIKPGSTWFVAPADSRKSSPRPGSAAGSVHNGYSNGNTYDPGLFSKTHLMPSIYHDHEWQRNTTCQDPHTSAGLPPLTFLGKMQGYWRGNLLFFDFQSYRQMLDEGVTPLYTGTFATHAIEMEINETVIRVRSEDVGGDGPLLFAGFKDEDSDEEVEKVAAGYGHQVLTGDEITAPEAPGWTKEILISGFTRSSWGISRVRGRIRSWDGLVTLSLGASQPYPMGRWVWRGYIHTGGFLIGRWRDTYTPEDQTGYEGPLGFIRAGDLFYPDHFPTSMATSAGTSKLELADNVAPNPAPGGRDPFRARSASQRAGSGSSDDPMDGSRPGPKRKTTMEKMMDDSGRPTSRGRRAS